MITLAMIKMYKNLRAVIEKGYPRKPYEEFTCKQLLDRIKGETQELEQARNDNELVNMLFEIADVSNLLDYLFEKVTQAIQGGRNIEN